MYHLLLMIAKILVGTLGLILIAISVDFLKKNQLKDKIVSIEEWKEMLILNSQYKKERTLLERKTIKLIVYEENE